jgi:hypothetical protein
MHRFTPEGYERRCEVAKLGVLDYFTPEVWDMAYDNFLRKNPAPRFSRRFCDFLVTEYARLHNCQYLLTKRNGSTRTFNVYHEAQTLLLGIHKKGVDAFNRKNKLLKNGGGFEFGYGDKKTETSVAQLCFFRWFIQNKVHAFAEEHEDHIREEMARVSQLKRLDKKRAKPLQEVVIQFDKKRQKPNMDEDSEDEMRRITNALLLKGKKKKRKRLQDNQVDVVMNNDVKVRFVFNK